MTEINRKVSAVSVSLLPLILLGAGTMALAAVLGFVADLSLEFIIAMELGLVLVHGLAGGVLKHASRLSAPSDDVAPPVLEASPPPGSVPDLKSAPQPPKSLGKLALQPGSNIFFGNGGGQGLGWSALLESMFVGAEDYIDAVEYLPGRWAFMLAALAEPEFETRVPSVEIATAFRLEAQKWTTLCGGAHKAGSGQKNRIYPELGTFLHRLDGFLKAFAEPAIGLVCLVMLLDIDSGETRISGGGFEAITIARNTGHSFEKLDLPASRPLGLQAGGDIAAVFKTARFFLSAGESLVFFSNGKSAGLDFAQFSAVCDAYFHRGEFQYTHGLCFDFSAVEQSPEQLVWALAATSVLGQETTGRPLIPPIMDFLRRSLRGADAEARLGGLSIEAPEPSAAMSILVITKA